MVGWGTRHQQAQQSVHTHFGSRPPGSCLAAVAVAVQQPWVRPCTPCSLPQVPCMKTAEPPSAGDLWGLGWSRTPAGPARARLGLGWPPPSPPTRREWPLPLRQLDFSAGRPASTCAGGKKSPPVPTHQLLPCHYQDQLAYCLFIIQNGLNQHR